MVLRLKDILKDRGESISSFASRVGITQANMSNIVNAKSSPTLDTLVRIANALNIGITELFQKEPSKEIFGYIEYHGKIYKVRSFEDLKKLLELECYDQL